VPNLYYHLTAEPVPKWLNGLRFTLIQQPNNNTAAPAIMRAAGKMQNSDML
jgi:hypothetical protein